jgi:hypothetical protein
MLASRYTPVPKGSGEEYLQRRLCKAKYLVDIWYYCTPTCFRKENKTVYAVILEMIKDLTNETNKV